MCFLTTCIIALYHFWNDSIAIVTNFGKLLKKEIHIIYLQVFY